jgi:hypothetical protein
LKNGKSRKQREYMTGEEEIEKENRGKSRKGTVMLKRKKSK